MTPRGAGGTSWSALLAMSLTVMVSFGVILYGFSIFVTAGAAGEEFSKTVLSAAYGGSVIAGGLLAVPLGVRADRVGVRGIIATGGLLAACGMLLFGRATASWHVLVAWWLLIGPAGAMTFYEIGFIVLMFASFAFLRAVSRCRTATLSCLRACFRSRLCWWRSRCSFSI